MINGFTITQTGLHHLKENKECQDASRLLFDENRTFAVGAIADGVGSCLYSREGAQMAVNTATDYLMDELQRPDLKHDDESLLQLMEEAFNRARMSVILLSQKQKRCYIEYDSTLTAAIYLNDGRLIWGHIGDDGIVALKKNFKSAMITKRNKGEFEHEVIPLRCCQYHSFAVDYDVASFAMMSDGVLDYCVDTIENDNRLHQPFFHCLLHVVCKIDRQMRLLRKNWEGIFNGNTEQDIRQYIHDDVTLLMVSNSDILQEMSKENGDDLWSIEVEKETKPSLKHRGHSDNHYRKHRGKQMCECHQHRKGKTNDTVHT